jgi:hypothetical protein
VRIHLLEILLGIKHANASIPPINNKNNYYEREEGFIFAIQDRVINTRNYKKTHMRFTIDN